MRAGPASPTSRAALSNAMQLGLLPGQGFSAKLPQPLFRKRGLFSSCVNPPTQPTCRGNVQPARPPQPPELDIKNTTSVRCAVCLRATYCGFYDRDRTAVQTRQPLIIRAGQAQRQSNKRDHQRLPTPDPRREDTMEAASARFAARDRWGDPAGPAPSQLQRFIQAACSPENYEPNLALNLEIADLINAKKGSTPREAAVAIVNYVNHRNPNVSLLALNLLDICVKNCGYPFHLQIATKDFLNELVRRFPERPPVRASRVQAKILEAIEEWRGTICDTSRYREDLGFIRDMHRLLSYKGYTFPEVRREDAAVLNPSDVCTSWTLRLIANSLTDWP